MPYFDSPIDEIKQRLDVVDIIREYIPLQQAGANWKARCPFHNEKTPSFMISKEKQIWHCFGCGKGGDVIEFVKEIEGIEFPEALRILAQKAGIALKRQDPKVISAKTRLFDLMADATDFFVGKLKSPDGNKALEYLSERGLTRETLEEWQIGWAPESWDGLGIYLRSKGFTDSQIVGSGMVVSKSLSPPSPPLPKSFDGAGGQGGTVVNRASYYDRFRGRIMFPIFDVSGSVVGFTGRVLVETEKSGGKYVNTPQTMIYNKSMVIFGLDKAKQEIRKKDLAVVVEGQMDVIASHQAGVCNVAASSGTALTNQQVGLLGRYTKNLAFCFDADSAGEQATKRGIDIALALGMNVKIIQIKRAKDPDELIKNQGAKSWQKIIENAVLVMKYYFDATFKKIDVSNIEGKREAARQLLGEIAKVSDLIERDYWVKELGSRLDVDERVLRASVRKIEVRRQTRDISNTLKHENLPAGRHGTKTRKHENKPKAVILGERIIGCSLKFPDTSNIWRKNNFDINIFVDKNLIGLAKSLIMYYNQGNNQNGENTVNASEFDYNEFKKGLTLELQKYGEVLVMLAEKDFGDLDLDDVKKEVQESAVILRKEAIISKLKQIEKDLKEAETGQDKGKIEKFSRKLEELMKQLGGLG